MVSINYQTYGKGFNLRLRLYQDGEVRYINVNKLLRGNILKRQWNSKRQAFTASAPYCEENNKVLDDFRKKYEDMAVGWKGSVASLVLAVNGNRDEKTLAVPNEPTMHELIEIIVSELKKNKHPDGTVKGTYEPYEKVERRLEEFCKYAHIAYKSLKVKDVTPIFVNSLFDWIMTKRKGQGFVYISKMLHAMLGKAESRDWFDMSTVKRVKWSKKPLTSAQKYRTLTPEQCEKLINMDRTELPKCSKRVLFRDFCVFILFTGQSPCDAISLQKSDIQIINGVKHFVFRRRKIAEKQAIPCCVPINPIMEKIIKRWSLTAKDGYIFPIRDKKKMATQKTNNGDIKKFISKCNLWLKKLGEALDCDFPLHLYTFRHTAITNYLSKKVPVIYVANMMGTSVQNCEKIYYNNQADKASMEMVLGMGKI